MSTATVTSKGQITIPAAVRKELGLRAGSRVSFVRTDPGVFEIRPQNKTITALKGVVPRPVEPVTIEAMDAAVTRAAGPAAS